MAVLTKRNARKVIRDLKHRAIGLPWMAVEPRDCFLASWPRSGNTWLRHILYFYVTGKDAVDMSGLDHFCPIIDNVDLKDKLASMGAAPQRFIKTHEVGAPYLMTGKVVFLVRDGRDATWSYHKYRQSFNRGTPDFDGFLKNCLKDRYRYLSWHRNVASWLRFREDPAFLLLRFEDMRVDPAATFRRILEHLEIEIDEDRLARAVAQADPGTVAKTFQSEIRARKSAGDGAGQGGVVERWRSSYTPEQLALFDAAAGDVLTTLGYPLSTD